MIKSFRDRDTQFLYSGRCPKQWNAFRSHAEGKLVQLDAAATLDFLGAPPGSRLEKRMAIEQDNGVSESMIVGESAFDGKIRMPGMSRSRIIIERRELP
jgi:hypothetical protein